MTGFIIATAIVVFIAVLGLFTSLSTRLPLIGFTLMALWVIGGMGLFLNAALEAESEAGPCHRYETHLQFNAATKTTMPYRVCVERGEWVEEGGAA